MTSRPAFVFLAALSLAPHSSKASELEPTLTRLARVAELYRDTALGFACQETIVYTGPASGRIQFAYIFIKDEHGRLRDFRTWKTGTTGKQRGQEVDPADYRVPRFLASAYLWAFVFRSDRQPLYSFRRLGEETVGNRTSVTIEFQPRGSVRKGLNDWAGYADIDSDTSQILRVEAYTPADWDRKGRRDADVLAAPYWDPRQIHPAYDVERIVTEFGFVKNGMRFPSHVEITTTRSTFMAGATHDVLRESTIRKVTQEYSRFEFFSVRTSAEIMRFVSGEGPLLAAPSPAP